VCFFSIVSFNKIEQIIETSKKTRE